MGSEEQKINIHTVIIEEDFMNALETIFTRRSVRKFNNKEISQENIETLLKAAMSAPSARNEQPWQFLVITDRKILDKIPTVHEYAQMCLQAHAAIITCADLSTYKYDDTFWVQDMAAATQNILLAARALELGAVWTGVYPNEQRINAVSKLFELPPKLIPFSIIPIGHTDVLQKEADRFQNDKIHYNKWLKKGA